MATVDLRPQTLDVYAVLGNDVAFDVEIAPGTGTLNIANDTFTAVITKVGAADITGTTEITTASGTASDPPVVAVSWTESQMASIGVGKYTWRFTWDRPSTDTTTDMMAGTFEVVARG